MAIIIRGLKSHMKDVTRLRANTKNLTPAFKRSVVLYHAWVVRNINSSGQLHENTSLRWSPLAESTRLQKERQGFSAQPLLRTGALRRDWELSSSSKYGRIRSAHLYSSAHEEGNDEGRPPQRKIFPTKEQGTKIIAPAFENHLYRGVKGVKIQ